MRQISCELGERRGITAGRPAILVWRYIRGILLAIDRKLALWHFRAKSRSELARLNSDVLRDVGLDPIEIGKEANKPFWRR